LLIFNNETAKNAQKCAEIAISLSDFDS
jgi:hypothetical protein